MTKPLKKKKRWTPTNPVAGKKSSRGPGDSPEISQTWYQTTSRIATPRKPSKTPSRGPTPPLPAIVARDAQLVRKLPSLEISQTWYQTTSRIATPRKPSKTPSRGPTPPLPAIVARDAQLVRKLPSL